METKVVYYVDFDRLIELCETKKWFFSDDFSDCVFAESPKDIDGVIVLAEMIIEETQKRYAYNYELDVIDIAEQILNYATDFVIKTKGE